MGGVFGYPSHRPLAGINQRRIAMAPQGDISMTEERLLVDWKTLKKLGWPYSRQHTFRLIAVGKFPQPKSSEIIRALAWRGAGARSNRTLSNSPREPFATP